jgi:hypothetical protein
LAIIFFLSTEAKDGGLQYLKINNEEVTLSFTQGKPEYYNKNGGPFQEPDFYGYSDQVTIPPLTYATAKWPEHWVNIPITIEFSSTATSASKVMILVSGTDAACKPALTPFSDGTLFVLPEYPLAGLAAILSCFGAFILLKKRSSLHL